jgi:hypothetical protein
MKIHLSLLKLAGILTLGCAVANSGLATPITGTVAFAGGVTLDNTDITLATTVVSFDAAFVSTRSGTFTSLSLFSPVMFNVPWTFNSGAVTNFWNVGTFQFDLGSSAIVSQNSSFLNVSGVGTIYDSVSGYDPTAGIWSFSIPATNNGGTAQFSFASSTSSASIPDGAPTAMLLGLGLLGLRVAFLRRKAA